MTAHTPVSSPGSRQGTRKRWLAGLVTAALVGITAALVPMSVEPAEALDNGLAPTPPMGWNSWNQVRCYDLTEELVKAQADAIVERGLDEVGYEYVVVDDCWQGGRGEDGVLFSHPERFPSGMAALADYVHGLGLKFGIYGVPGSETCANYWDNYPIYGLGSYGHERTDAETFAAWGVDYLKYDWCRADVTDGLTHAEAFTKMRDELAALDRPIVYGISEYGDTRPWEWAEPVANLWRTTHDIQPRWDSISGIIDSQAALAEHSGPGGWNDPDMLQIGNGQLTLDENISHVAMWSMLAAPLFLGTDIGALPQPVVDVLANPELVAIDQDTAGRQAERVANDNGRQVWARTLANGDIAVAFHNTSNSEQTISTTLEAVGATGAVYTARDVLARQTVTNVTSTFGATVPSHGTVVYRLSEGSDPSLPGLVSGNGTADISQGEQATVEITVENNGATLLKQAVLTLGSKNGVTPLRETTRLPAIKPGASKSVKVKIAASADAPIGSALLPAVITTTSGSEQANVTIRVMPPAPTGTAYISDLPFIVEQNGWQDMNRDLSQDGKPLTVGGETWAKGIGTNSPSTVGVWLGGRCTTLTGAFGVDDDTLGGDPRWGHPSIDGLITGDGTKLWSTSQVLHYQELERFTVDVAGVNELVLKAGIGSDTNAYDHADWLDMELACS